MMLLKAWDFATAVPALATSLRTITAARLPDDRAVVRRAIASVPHRYQAVLKSAACWQAHRAGTNHPMSVSIDTTMACNFACPHCYVSDALLTPTKENIERGKSIAEWEERLEQLTADYPFLMHAGWLGGEPLLRRDLIERCSRFFNQNWVHTNGYLGFPILAGADEHAIQYVVSVDGHRAAHDEMRPTRGSHGPTYDRILANIRNSTGRKILVHTVVSKSNRDTLRPMIDDLASTGRVEKVGFSLQSADRGEPPVFTHAERDGVIDQLSGLRREYGGFIWTTPSWLRSMRSSRIQDTYGAGCMLRLNAAGTASMLPLDNNGELKGQCVMGADHSCDDCACAIPPMFKGQFERTGLLMIESLPMVGRLLDRVAG